VVLSVHTATVSNVKIVVQMKVLPTPAQAAALAATLPACNDGANLASRVAFGEFGLNARQVPL
jgi:hypothetical protein